MELKGERNGERINLVKRIKAKWYKLFLEIGGECGSWQGVREGLRHVPRVERPGEEALREIENEAGWRHGF
jgi:hypothetical protein